MENEQAKKVQHEMETVIWDSLVQFLWLYPGTNLGSIQTSKFWLKSGGFSWKRAQTNFVQAEYP